MASNQEQVNGEDFSQDVNASEEQHINGSEQGAAGEKQNGDSNGSAAEAPGRDDDRKLFVGGLSWETTEKELREHFGQYGEIESINVKTDPQTGRSRGFAFIVYSAAESIEKVTAVTEHIINNKKVDPKKAKARHGKIFVGGLTTDISDEEIKTFFGQFGNIIEVEMPFDKQKNQRKGFCFITFDSEQVVNELLKTPKQIISGKEVDVKKATPKPDNVGPVGIGGARGNPRGRQQRGWGNQSGYGYQGYGYGYGSGYDSYGAGAGGYDYYSGGYNSYPDYSGYPNYGGNYQGGKQQRGGGRQPRHQPY